MHLGTSTTILLAFSLLGDLCSPKKPPEPPDQQRSSGANEREKELLASTHADKIREIEANLAKVEQAEAEYNAWEATLTAKAKASEEFKKLRLEVEKIDRAKQRVLRNFEAFKAWFAANKNDPSRKNFDINREGGYVLVDDIRGVRNMYTDIADEEHEVKKLLPPAGLEEALASTT